MVFQLGKYFYLWSIYNSFSQGELMDRSLLSSLGVVTAVSPQGDNSFRSIVSATLESLIDPSVTIWSTKLRQ